MNRILAVAVGVFAGWLATVGPAQAHGRVHWSVTIGSHGHVAPHRGVVVVPPRGVVVVPQSQYIYGAPPSAFALPPPPAVVYVQPAYPVYPPPVLYVDPYGRQIHPRHHHRRHGWNDWDDRHRGGRWEHRR